MENEIVGVEVKTAKTTKEFASVILDEELAKSLFDSPEAAVNQIISVNEFITVWLALYTSNEAKTAKAFGIGGLPITTNFLSQPILILMKFRTSSFVSMILV